MRDPFPWEAGLEVPLVVGGHTSASGAWADDPAPASSELLAKIQTAEPTDVSRAVSSAREAQHEWHAMGARERGERIHLLAELLGQHTEALARTDARDTGSPLSAMAGDIRKGIGLLHLYSGLALEMQGRTIPASEGLHFTLPQPWGVVGAITAYNHPFLFACIRTGPALIAGNAVILKPAPQTPLSALALQAIADEVLPAGVLTVLPGGPQTGTALVAHPDVQRISFTGSVETGALVQEIAGRSKAFKSLTLELGGKNPILVFPDVDPDEAAEAIVRGMNFTRVQGQSCGSTSRLLVQERMRDVILERVVREVSKIRLGMPEDETTQMGSLITLQHRQRVLDFIGRGTAEGAKLLFGGKIPAASSLERGAFLEPTVFDEVHPSSQLASDEIFGPVLSTLAFSAEDEAIAIANSTRYGLSASVWTNDIDRAMRIAQRLEVGYLWINDVETRYPGVPFGGWKRSGIGTEQGLAEEILSFTRNKSVNLRVRANATAHTVEVVEAADR